MISLIDALLCVSCDTVVAAPDVRGEQCPKCAASCTMLSLSRVLRQEPELGAITFVYSAGRA